MKFIRGGHTDENRNSYFMKLKITKKINKYFKKRAREPQTQNKTKIIKRLRN